MIHELIYTSAQSGLKPGSRGYCTVASSAGMSKPMAEKLESLSGYRHIFPPGTIQADQNPVAFSFMRLQIAGIPCFVLSRVADAGLDYSGRSNKLAHHVVLEQKELVEAGPAACLADRRFTLKNWSGDARVLPPKSVPPLEPLRPSRENWESVSGDPNWCDYLLNNVCKGKPVYVVYPVGTDVLPLIVDAQSLLPSDDRWNMTFSTYFTRIPPGVECLVRCIPAGTKEARAILGRHDQIRIDLSNPTTAPTTSIVKPPHAQNGDSESDIDVVMEATLGDTDSGELKIAPPEIPLSRHKAFRISPLSKNAKKKSQPVLVSVALGLLLAVLIFGGLAWRGALSRTTEPHQAQRATSDESIDSENRKPTATSEDENASHDVKKNNPAPSMEHDSGNATDVTATPNHNESTEDDATDAGDTAESSSTTDKNSNTTTPPPARSKGKRIHWMLGEEPKQAVSANAIASIQVRPPPASFEIKTPDEVDGQWLVNGPDEEGFDSTYLRARVDPSTQSLEISSGNGGDALAMHTVVVKLDDAREVFVHSQPTLDVKIRDYEYQHAEKFKLLEMVIPVVSSIRCAARFSVNGGKAKDLVPTNSSDSSDLLMWIKIDKNLAIQLTIDREKRVGRLRPYMAVGKPPKPMMLSDVMAAKSVIRRLVEAVDDADYILKRVSSILEMHESPDDGKRLSKKQQKQIRNAAEEIVRDLRMIEAGTRQFKLKQHLNSAQGKKAAGSIVFLSQATEGLPKLPDSRVRPLERFKEFLTESIKDWKAEKGYRPEVYKTLQKVQQIEAIDLDIVLFKAPEMGGKFPILRVQTMEAGK